MIKRVAVISYHTCPLSDEHDSETGGLNTYVLELSKALAKKGYLIDIYTRCVDKNSPAVVKLLPNLRIIHLPAEKLTEFVRNFDKFIRKEQLSYDLVSAHYYLSGLIGLEIKKKLKIPLAITFHTLALMKNLVAKSENERDSQRIKSEMLLVKESDRVIATSRADLEYINTLYGCSLKKILLLSPGVDLKLFRPIGKDRAKKFVKADLKHKLILFVGRIEPLKGIDVLLYALKILVQNNLKIPLCLWIVGANNTVDKKKVAELKRLVEIKNLLGIENYVKFVGQKGNAELPYYYNSAEIVVMPSQYESFGIVALEAMACGIPVITTDVTGISGLLDKKHSSLLTSASNPIDLAKKIKNLLTNKHEHQKMSENVLKKVQDLSWENVADKFTQSFST